MRRGLAVSLGLFAATIVAGAAPAEAASKLPSCSKNGTTLEKSESVRVYELSDDEGNHTIKACRIATRKRTTLSEYFSCDCSTGDESPPDSIQLNGLIVLVITSPTTGPPGSDGPPTGAPPGTTTPITPVVPNQALSVFDLGSGFRRTVFARPGELVLRRQGSFAYRQGAELHAVPRKGQDTVIDTGPVEAGTLRLEGKTLSWIGAGQPRTATLD